jgi:hypothetical protein
MTLDEVVLAMRKHRIPGSRTAVWRFFQRHKITFKKTYGAPRSQVVFDAIANQSASTYPVSGSVLPAKTEIRAFWS